MPENEHSILFYIVAILFLFGCSGYTLWFLFHPLIEKLF